MTAPSSWQVQRVVSLARETVETLRTEHGQVIDDETEMLAVLAEENLGVDAILRRLVRASLEAKDNAAAVKLRISDLQARKARFERQEQVYRNTVLAAMEALELKKYPDPEFSLSVSVGRPKVIVTDVKQLADTLVTIEVIRTPHNEAILAAINDREALNKALIENGEEPIGDLEGAVLSNPQNILTIRSR